MAQNSQKSSSTKRKRFKFEFGPAGMVGLCSVMVLIMAWAFILGILVGRGYKPESVIAELGHMVPPLGKPSPSLPSSGTLLPEELGFFETLQEKTSPVMPPAPPRREAARTVQTPQTQPQVAPKPEPVVPAPAPDPQPVHAAPVEQRFEYVYQAAAFQTEAQARALQERIADVGGTTSVEVSVQNGQSWYRVLITLRGSAKDEEQLIIRLQGHGITDPFLRAKKSL